MSESNTKVAVVMGSDNDFEIMSRCIEQLNDFGIATEVRVLSAHRTPGAVDEFAAGAADRGIKVIIAAAGMSAALAGAVSSRTTLPVLGVAIASGPLAGIDALLSTVQMPPGVSVGCTGIGAAGAVNAAVLAAEILATSDADLAGKLAEYKSAQADKTLAKDEKLREQLGK
ncbi:MAG: 5-(carboxyamino)imidazole ribonucleotide mutase [Planctomycetota bacterium]|nr:5-(carboxyamino)imidazole ribonucleotide mutase [Planctomycetota bacterium]